MGIAVPDGLVVDGGDCPSSRETSWLGAPLVVRPGLSWRAFGGAWIRGGVSYEADENAIARRAVEDAALRFPYLVQRVIRGDGCGLFLLAQEGRLLRVFSHRRLREKPPSGGVSTLCVSVAAPEDLTEAARRWAAGLRWSGLAMLEFKRDTITGQPFLLEVNARPWGSMALAAAAGIDFPREVLAMERPDSPERVPGYRPGVRLRWWWGDVDHFYLQEKKRGRRGRTALARGLARAALAGPWPEAWDTFRCDDPVPFAFETLQWVRS
jgi:predicted ATP-grasp superfamily ATP-dependent carboligase